MDSKKLQKKYGLNIDEEKDPFLSSLNKRYRNNRKKIEQIEELEKRDRSTLKSEQLEKIKNRAEIQENVKYLDGIKDMYYSALKTAQDEGKLPKTTSEATSATRTEQREEQPQEETKPQETKPEPVQQRQEPTQSAEERQAEVARISRDNLSKIVNLVHFAQFFRDQSRVQEFRQAFDSNRGDFRLDSAPDFESFAEFYTKVFTFSESDKLGKVGDKISSSLGELESYVNGGDQPALRNKSYKHLQSVVEGITSSSFFKDHSADVSVPPVGTFTEPGPIGSIGSELRKGHEQQETVQETIQRPVSQKSPQKGSPQKTSSPQKGATQAVKPVEIQEENKQDWGALEDEEGEAEEGFEEEGEGGEQTGQPTEEKQEKKGGDDEFITVTTKRKEKKEEPFRGSGAGFRGRGGRGGGRGGPRGDRRPRPEGEAGVEGGERRGGYRGPRGDRRPPGEEGPEEGENAGEGNRGRGGYRGGRGGFRGEGRGGFRGEGRGGYRGEGRGGFRGEGRGGYRGEGRGGYRGDRGGAGAERGPGEEVVNRAQE